MKTRIIEHDITRGTRLAKVVVALYQPKLSDSMFRQDPSTFLYHLKDERSFYDKLERNIAFLIDKSVNIFCLPELCMTKSMSTRMERLAKEYKLIIIGGSYYEYRKATCPIITPTGIFKTEKISPSPFEKPPFSGVGMVLGQTVSLIKSRYGNFAVLICYDFLDSTIRNLLLQHSLDFIFVIACNPDSQRFHGIMSSECQNAQQGLYICYANCAGIFDADGKSAIFGVMDKLYLKMLRGPGFKPDDNILYKVCEIEDDEFLIAEFDLLHKKPPITKGFQEKPNIQIIYPPSAPVRLFEPEQGLFIDIPNNALKNMLKRSLNSRETSLFDLAWQYIRQQNTMITIEQLKGYIINEIKELLEQSFEQVLDKYRETAIPKVTGWEHLFSSTGSFSFKSHSELKENIVIACNTLADEFPNVPSKMNVLSCATPYDEDLESILITGHDTNKANIAIGQIAEVSGQDDGFFKYNGPFPSCEAPINWAIHKRTAAQFVVHINTKEIFKFAYALLDDPMFSEIIARHPSLTISNQNITICRGDTIFPIIHIVENATHVDVRELAEMISSAFSSNDTLVIGKRHAAWFIVDKKEDILEKTRIYNKMVGDLVEDYFHLRNGQLICPSCSRRIRMSIDDAESIEIKCPYCKTALSGPQK